ncbi:MAG TPA: M55 family metallopeptidase [Gemmatimonadaceae bacterium]|jgi:D-amino peptidase|nr:M55 family metallopeptidase [Gemmatimonadota bacterium]HPV76798.1 M55 family metallopeptidase [Gemmatimonadaceae bacterium]MBK7836019.1 M55 family metallopeptidase [Gemmatimonadota bacterium]MBK8062411.1 M55 family metallopeptidase [Gemmatimonadota bacterium]MBK9407802.1 M55 family metallopeptidase [Gemmatimonadota bacterium]
MSGRPIAFGCALALLAVAAVSPRAAQAQRALKVYISVDMEGITGVVSSDQLGPTSFEYQRAREWMTGEALAAIQGARDAGATEIVVSDSHGNGENLLIDQFPDDITIVRSWPRPNMMMEGVDSSFAAAVFIGYHSGTSNVKGVRAHTMSSATLTGVKLNGREVPEGGINAAIAGYYGVPIVMVSGDDAAVAEVSPFGVGMEGAIVKRAISFHSAATMTPKAGQALIRARVKAGVEKRARITPYVLSGAVTADISFKHYRAAEMLTYLPIVTRVDAHTIRFTGKNILEVSRFLEFVNTYQTDLTP